MKTKLSCTIHGLTRCREIIGIIRKLGLGISYQDVKNLYATWTYNDIKSSCCPIEIAKYFPGTAIMDNDDFQDDTLTGAETSHCTTGMYSKQRHLKSINLFCPHIKILKQSQRRGT